ncbi:MAG: DUF2783 domain-containing protein [Flavobacteriaceae bacterium]
MSKGNQIDLSADRFAGAGDDFYQALIEAHEGLSAAQSSALNARLVLLLANQVGDIEALRAAVARARRGIG